MIEWLQGIVTNVVGNEKVAASVSAVSVASGLSGLFEFINPILGCISMVMGIILSHTLNKNRKKKGKLMDQESILMSAEIKLKKAQIKELGG